MDLIPDGLKRLFNKFTQLTSKSKEGPDFGSEEGGAFIDAVQGSDTTAIAKYLKKYPAAVRKTGYMHKTALMFAVEATVDRYKKSLTRPESDWDTNVSQYSRDTFDRLLRSGAAINAQDDEGRTILDRFPAEINLSAKAGRVLQMDKEWLIKEGAKTGAQLKKDADNPTVMPAARWGQ